MFQISSSPTRHKATSTLAVLAAIGANGLASKSDAATTAYNPTMSAWTTNSAYAYLPGETHWHDFLTDVTNPSWHEISGAGTTYGSARAWFDWNLNGLGTTFSVSQATLKLQALAGYYGLGPGRTVSLGLITDTWDATKPNTDPANTGPGAWNASGFDGNGPNLVGADGNPSNLLIYTSTTDGGEFNVNVTSLLQTWAANPTTYHGIGVYSPDTANSHGGIEGPNSEFFPGITGNLTLETASLGPIVSTWSSPTQVGGDWTVASNWNDGVPNGVDHEAKLLGNITANRTVFTDSNITLGKLQFDNANTYNVAGNGTLTMQVSSGSGLIEVISGTQKINLPLVIASNTDLNVADGATLKISDPVTINSGVALSPSPTGNVVYESTVTLLPSATIAFSSSQHVAALTVGDNATATVNQDGSHVLEVDNLLVSSTGGKVDLKDNAMVFRDKDAGTWTGTAYTGVSELVASGKVTTSMADAADLLTTLAVNTDGNGDTHVVYTYAGDSNADGGIDGEDYFAIDQGFNTNAKFYANGDFDYSGKIDVDDYWLIDRNYSRQSSPFGPDTPAGVAAVPEPASIGLLASGLGAMLIRRRRRA